LLPALAVGFIASGPARGGTVFTLPGSLNGKAGSSSAQMFTSDTGGYTMYATGYSSTVDLKKDTLELGKAVFLYGKHDGAGESGLGINRVTDNEIGSKQTIEIDLSNFYSSRFGAVTLKIGSVQKNEGYALFGGASGPTDFLHAFVDTSGNNVVTTYEISQSEMLKEGGKLYLTADGGNVVLDSVTVASVPEPGTIALLLTGMTTVGLGWSRRRKVS